MVIFQYLSNIIQIYSIILVIYALLSWFPGAPQSTLGQMVHRLVEPFLSLFRKLPLQFGGLGFYSSSSTFGLELDESVISPLVPTFDWIEYDGTDRDLPTFQSRRSRIH